MAEPRGNRRPSLGAGRPRKKPTPAKKALASRTPDDRFARSQRPGWGNVARRGAREVLARPDEDRPRRAARPAGAPPRPWQPDEWVRESETVRERAANAVARGDQAAGASRSRSRSRRRAPAPITAELAAAVGERRTPKVERQLVEAARALERGAAPEAYRLVRPLTEQAPQAAAVREVAGLALYRMGRWKQAVAQLEAFVRLTGSVEQHPVLADGYRALGRHAKVETLWDELRRASPGPELVTEGRIVMAGSLADRGELAQAITVLEKGPVAPKRSPALHHLRLWYALADLYERVGDAPRARQLFARVAAVDPGLADTAERLQALA